MKHPPFHLFFIAILLLPSSSLAFVNELNLLGFSFINVSPLLFHVYYFDLSIEIRPIFKTKTLFIVCSILFNFLLLLLVEASCFLLKVHPLLLFFLFFNSRRHKTQCSSPITYDLISCTEFEFSLTYLPSSILSPPFSLQILVKLNHTSPTLHSLFPPQDGSM